MPRCALSLPTLPPTSTCAASPSSTCAASLSSTCAPQCLEDPDDTLKRKTLDLLYRMINPVNVGVIVDKLLAHLRAASDTYLRTDLVTRITAAAERFAPSNSWYIGTMTTVFELGGDLVRPEVSQNLIRLVAEGAGESEAADEALRREAVITYCGLLEHPSLPDVLLQVGVLGLRSTVTPPPCIA